MTRRGQNQPRDFAQSTLGAIARNGVAKFLRAGKADPHRVGWGALIVAARAGLKQKAGRALPPRLGGPKEIRAFGENLQNDHRRRRLRRPAGLAFCGFLRRCHAVCLVV
jgi:hypothetical protein